jgi:hypothetical protein
MLTDMSSKNIDIPIDTKFDEIYKMVHNSIESYGTELKKAGKYKQCQGNGWYTIEQLVKVKGNYFIS